MKMASRESAEHYRWGSVCDGWRLVDRGDCSVIEERVPLGAAEVRHYHEAARQFSHALAGEATLEIEGEIVVLAIGQGIEVAPRRRHQFMNQSDAEVFLVFSTPSTKDDRVVVDAPL